MRVKRVLGFRGRSQRLRGIPIGQRSIAKLAKLIAACVMVRIQGYNWCKPIGFTVTFRVTISVTVTVKSCKLSVTISVTVSVKSCRFRVTIDDKGCCHQS